MAKIIKEQLVVFDFDWYAFSFEHEVANKFVNDCRSLADQDTDRWVLEVLAPDLRRKMKTLKNEIQWTDLVYAVLSSRMDLLSNI
jgi:pyridoxal phosphate phosphatase PHOSPHO2